MPACTGARPCRPIWGEVLYTCRRPSIVTFLQWSLDLASIWLLLRGVVRFPCKPPASLRTPVATVVEYVGQRWPNEVGRHHPRRRRRLVVSVFSGRGMGAGYGWMNRGSAGQVPQVGKGIGPCSVLPAYRHHVRYVVWCGCSYLYDIQLLPSIRSRGRVGRRGDHEREPRHLLHARSRKRQLCMGT